MGGGQGCEYMKAAAVPYTIEPRDVLIVDCSTVSHDLLIVGPWALTRCLAWHAGDRAPLINAFVDEMRSLARHGAAVFLLFEGVDTSGGAAPQEPTRERLRRDAAQREAIRVVASYGGDHAALRRDAEATTDGANRVRAAVLGSVHGSELKQLLLAELLKEKQQPTSSLDNIVPLVSPRGTENDHMAVALHRLLLAGGVPSMLVFNDGDMLVHGVPVLIAERVRRSSRPRRAAA